MDSLCVNADPHEILHDFISSMLCASEDQDTFNRFIFQYFGEQMFLVFFVHEIDDLIDGVRGARNRCDFDSCRIGEDRFRELDDSSWHGR